MIITLSEVERVRGKALLQLKRLLLPPATPTAAFVAEETAAPDSSACSINDTAITRTTVTPSSSPRACFDRRRCSAGAIRTSHRLPPAIPTAALAAEEAAAAALSTRPQSEERQYRFHHRREHDHNVVVVALRRYEPPTDSQGGDVLEQGRPTARKSARSIRPYDGNISKEAESDEDIRRRINIASRRARSR